MFRTFCQLWFLLILGSFLAAPAATAGVFKGHPYHNPRSSVHPHARAAVSFPGYAATAHAEGCPPVAAEGMLGGHPCYDAPFPLESYGGLAMSSAFARGTICPPVTDALLRVWVDERATVWVNGQRTKPQRLAGVHRGSRIFTLTRLTPGQEHLAVVRVQLCNAWYELACQEETIAVRAGGSYEVSFSGLDDFQLPAPNVKFGVLVAPQPNAEPEAQTPQQPTGETDQPPTPEPRAEPPLPEPPLPERPLREPPLPEPPLPAESDAQVEGAGSFGHDDPFGPPPVSKSPVDVPALSEADPFEDPAPAEDAAPRGIEPFMGDPPEQPKPQVEPRPQVILDHTRGGERISSRQFEIVPGGQLAARLVYDETKDLVLSGVVFDGKFLPDDMTFQDTTDWQAMGIAPGELSPNGELELTLIAKKADSQEVTFGDDSYKIQIQFPTSGDRSHRLIFAGGTGDATVKNIQQWIAETLAKNEEQADDALFLSDQIERLIVKGTFKIGAGESTPLKSDLVIEVLQ